MALTEAKTESVAIIDEVEVLVVGAGPAGSSCAAGLAESGHDVLLVDQSSFPRPKACGDGLGPTGVSVLERLELGAVLDDAYDISGLRVMHGKDSIWTKRFTQTAKCISRNALDEAILRSAMLRGARFLKGRVDRPLTVGGEVEGVVLRTADADVAIRARCIIAADGTTSRLKKTTGLGRSSGDPRARAVRQYYRTEHRLEPTFDFFSTTSLNNNGLVGYGWIFPLADHLANVGIGYYDDHGVVPSLRHALNGFLDDIDRTHGERYGELEPVDKMMGAFLGVGQSIEEYQYQRMLFIGDAGHMTDPITGEGISHALRAGTVVAKIAGDALTSGREWHSGTDISVRLRRSFLRLNRDTGLVRRLAARHLKEGDRRSPPRTFRREPFLDATARMLVAPDEEPTLANTAVLDLLDEHDPDTARALATVNELALDALQTEFPFATETLHREMRAHAGPAAAAALVLAARLEGRAANQVATSAAVGVELLSLFPVFAAQAVNTTSDRRSVVNNAMAVLVADFAVTRALRCGVLGGSRMAAQFARVGSLMCEGEMLAKAHDLLVEDPLERYVAAADLARGSLYALAVAEGARLGGCSETAVCSLGEYGHALGVAMRASDDMCEMMGREGKSGGNGRRLRIEHRFTRAAEVCKTHTEAARAALRPLGAAGDALSVLTDVPLMRLNGSWSGCRDGPSSREAVTYPRVAVAPGAGNGMG